MFDTKIKMMHDAIKDHLIAKHGAAFLSLSKHHQCAMISHTFLEYMKAQRERQEYIENFDNL